MQKSIIDNLFLQKFSESQIIETSDTIHGKSCAIYTDEFKSRIFLSRIWGAEANYINFIMLNPSTATHEKLDPTVTRCYNWSKCWGFSGMFITNIFAHRSTNPANLKTAINPIGSGNDNSIKWCANNSNKIIIAWGLHGKFLNRDQEVLNILKKNKLYALKLTKSNTPSHPLYLPKNTEPLIF
jgi:hypothetical protein